MPIEKPKTSPKRSAIAFSLLLYIFEAIQSIALIPFFRHTLGSTTTAYWITLTASLALVSLAYSPYYQLFVRNLSIATDTAAEQRIDFDWKVVRRRAGVIGGILLLVSQGIFSAYAAKTIVQLTNFDQIGIIVLFLAWHLRLQAYNNFILLNGSRNVGSDKRLLLTCSILATLLLVSCAAIFGNIISLAISLFLSNGLLYFLSSRATSNFTSTASTLLPLPSSKEMLAVFLLGLGGYLNMNTDVLLSSHFLSTPQLVPYATTSRITLAAVSLAGLWTQIKFPFWSMHSGTASAFKRELLLASSVIIGASVFLLLVTSAFSLRQDSILGILPRWMPIVIVVNGLLAALTILLGQVLTSRRQYSFIKPAIGIACTAPMAAYIFAQFGSMLFVIGYAFANLVLVTVHIYCIRLMFQKENIRRRIN